MIMVIIDLLFESHFSLYKQQIANLDHAGSLAESMVNLASWYS